MVRLGAVVAGIVVLVAVVNAYSGSKFLGEGLEGSADWSLRGPLSNNPSAPTMVSAHSEGGDAAPSLSQESKHPTGQQTYSQSILSPEELLPRAASVRRGRPRTLLVSVT